MPGGSMPVFRLVTDLIGPGADIGQGFAAQQFPDGGSCLGAQVIFSDLTNGTVAGDPPGKKNKGHNEQYEDDKGLSFFHACQFNAPLNSFFSRIFSISSFQWPFKF